MSEVPPGKKRAVSDDSNTAQTVGWKLRSMLSAKYGAAAVNSNPHDLLIVSLKKHFVNKLTDSIIVKKDDVYL